MSETVRGTEGCQKCWEETRKEGGRDVEKADGREGGRKGGWVPAHGTICKSIQIHSIILTAPPVSERRVGTALRQ